VKTVLLLVHQDAGQEARLRAALDLARGLPAQLHCLDVTPLPQIYDSGWAPPVILDEHEQEADNAAKLRQRLQEEGVDWRWSEAEGDFADCLLAAARHAEVVVLNRRLDAGNLPNMTAIASRVLTGSESLVAAVSETSAGFDLAAPALVAWDGSDNALSALRRAVSFLALAPRVHLFQAGALPKGAIAAADAVAELACEGIAAEVEIGEGSGDPAVDICAAARRIHAGYCVMGAYGHSRLREALFGGVSRRMLTVANLPLLMAH
jgi:nucleotide-binding universal stress UspA family protein